MLYSGTLAAVPPVLGGVDGAGADVVDADGAGEVVEVDVELACRHVVSDGDGFVVDSLPEITVPVTGAVLKRLMPVVPEVAASSVSALLPEMWFPMIELLFMLTGGAGDGADAWLCMVTPGRPLL